MLVGLDVGTSSLKGLIIDGAGEVVASATREYPVARPREGWSEQDPAHWWEAARLVVQELLASPRVDRAGLRALGLSGQMHGSVLLSRESVAAARDARAIALRPAILWNDQRTAAECEEIESLAGGREALVRAVGSAALPGFTLPKLLWIRRHEMDLWERAACGGVFCLPKDYVRLNLTGELATDVGDAAGTLLLDVQGRDWHQGFCRAAGIDPEMLPPVLESAAVAGRISSAAAALTGLPEGLPVVAGSGDNMAGAVGAGVVEPGMILATLGTSGVIFAHAREPRRDLPLGRLHTMCAATGTGTRRGEWSLTGCMLCAAGSLAWARETIAPGVAFEVLDSEAAAVAPGCEGLVFLPYLTGERCPHPDPRARGGWIGLTARHTRGHLIRAVLEGVAFGMGQMLDLARGVGVPAERARIGGGGARSELWRQIMADALGVPISTTNTHDGPAYGAALLAGVGSGAGNWLSVVDACRGIVREEHTAVPSKPSEAFVRARSTYDHLYPTLQDSMHALGTT